MWYNEYHIVLNSGYNPDELTLFFFSDFGLNFPEDGLYCLEDTYRANPDLCKRFVQASLRGWLYAFENQAETVDLVMKHADAAHTGTNKAHQRWMLARMKDLILPDGNKSGMGEAETDGLHNRSRASEVPEFLVEEIRHFKISIGAIDER